MIYDGFTPEDLAVRLGSPRCLVLPRVTSTMDLVHALAAEGAPAGTVVLADEQVAGRGQRGRVWLSPAGAGVWLGYLVRPETAAAGGVLALRVGLAVVAALGDLGVSATLKWPNDVMLNEKKLAGILCEARTMAAGAAGAAGAGGRGWVALGIGLNVRGPVPAELADQATALDGVVPGVTRTRVLEHLVPRLHRLEPEARLSGEERAAYGQRDWLAGRLLREPVRGRALGIDEDGALLVAGDAGRQRVVSGTVVTA
ncbi:MAG TPA: biotin--[acetyl-CoA-carboxylase] ligase [Gemmatimonadales bacterium]|nr:biotin--[acetyl-CoA-carboxylase] ligase [Gemmatimonadales bacterium]